MNELNGGIQKYDKLWFVEFLELLGRIASIRFVETEFENEPLIVRLEYIVDAALGIVNIERVGKRRGRGGGPESTVESEVSELAQSASDEDY